MSEFTPRQIATGSRRLLKLAEFLETKVPRKQFSMHKWVSHHGESGIPLNEDVGDCGTAACAMGWATAIPSFQRAGLHLARGGKEYGRHHMKMTPLYQRQRGMNAAAKFMAIDFDDATALFDPEFNDGTPKQVAKRIRQFVAKRGA